MKCNLTINERLKDLRTNQRLTLGELSEKTGIPSSTLGNYEQDDYLVPHDIVLRMAEYYGVSTDYLFGLTDNHMPHVTSVSDLHLSDQALAVIRNKDTNTRLLSEIIASDAFNALLIDTEIYVDGYVEQSIDEYNTLMELARKKMAEKYGTDADAAGKTLEHSKFAQQEYFGRVLADDLIIILDEIKENHRKDKETSDGAYTPEDYERIYKTVEENRSSPLKGLPAGILEAFRIKQKDRNLQNAKALLDKDMPTEKEVADLVRQSPIVEPAARKRRKR